MSQFRRGLNKNANNPQFRRSVKATSWKARNKTKRKQKAHQIARENYDLYEADEGRSRGALSRVPRLLRLLVYSFFFYFFFCHTQHFLCGRFMSWDMEWWPLSHSYSLSSPPLISSPASVAHFAAWALFMVQHLRSVAQLQLQFCWTGLINLESANWFT